MPENTQMKLQFLEIDGRRVPAFLPQHWNGDGWSVTGKDNPLPVGNHVMSEGGIWIPEPEVRDTRVTGSYVEDGIDVNLLNREVKQVTLVDSLAFRGTSSTITQVPFEAHAYKDFEISIRNSLVDEEGNGVTVSVGFVTNGATEVFLKDGRSVLYSHYTAGGRVWNEVPGNDRLYYLTDLPIVGMGVTEDAELNTPNIWKLFKSNNNTPQIAFGRVDRNQVPVEGTLSCWLDGVKN